MPHRPARPFSRAVGASFVFAIFAPVAPAQSWNADPPAPTVMFGVDGDLLTSNAQGLIGFDELLGRTLLPLAGGWSPLPSSVPPRVSSTLVATGVNTFVFGGLDATSNAPRNDLWMWNVPTADWLQLSPGGATAPGPGPRFGVEAAPWDDGWSLVFFGGADTSGVLDETWAMLQVTTLIVPPIWVLQTTPPALVGRTGHCMARAPGEQVVMFGGDNGGALGDTWLYDPIAGWAQHTGVGPPAASGCRMAYDRGRDMTVLVHPNGETWEWNGIRWRRVGATGGPTWSQPAVAFAPTSQWSGEVVAVQQDATGTVTWR